MLRSRPHIYLERTHNFSSYLHLSFSTTNIGKISGSLSPSPIYVTPQRDSWMHPAQISWKFISVFYIFLNQQLVIKHTPIMGHWWCIFSRYFLKRKYFCPQVNCFLHLLWSKQHHPQNPHDVVMPPVSDLCLSYFTLAGTTRHYFFSFHPGRLKVCPCRFSLWFAKGVFLLFCFLNQRMIIFFDSIINGRMTKKTTGSAHCNSSAKMWKVTDSQ